MIRLGSVLVLILLWLACSSSDSGPSLTSPADSATADQSSADKEAIREAADRLIQAVNNRDYDTIVSVAYTTNCSSGITVEQQEQGWEAVGRQLGDDAYSLEIRQFEVKNIIGDRAEVTATVIAHAAGREVPFGRASDPFFDLFVREDGQWKVGDPAC